MQVKSKNYIKRGGFFAKVYEVVRGIPEGKVMTYGQVARRLGTADARKVGWALAANSDPNTPCHRVVNKEGGLAKNFGKSLDLGAMQGFGEQKRRLVEEGVGFQGDRVDLEKCLYEGG